MKKLMIVLISIILLFGCTQQTTAKTTENKLIEQDQKMENKVSGSTEYQGEKIAGSTTPYIRYNDADFDKARESGKAIYLYFYANWCPICTQERPNIFTAFNEMKNENAIGFEVHFNDDKTTDEDRNKARELGVSYQHTTIILDKKGAVFFRSLTPIDTEEIKLKIKEAAR